MRKTALLPCVVFGCGEPTTRNLETQPTYADRTTSEVKPKKSNDTIAGDLTGRRILHPNGRTVEIGRYDRDIGSYYVEFVGHRRHESLDGEDGGVS